MKRLLSREDDEQHNFWQNYTDLLSGLLIVFILISITVFIFYQKMEKEIEHYKKQGSEIEVLAKIKNVLNVTEVNDEVLNKIIEDRKLFKQVEAFYKTLENIENNSSYFHYNKNFRRLECKIQGSIFLPNEDRILYSQKEDLILAGKELDEEILAKLNDTLVGIKVIIDGRVARYMDIEHEGNTMPDPENAASLSYKRSKALYNLWKDAGYLSSIERRGEIFFSGSGYGGQGRYSGVNEDLNKRFIIEIIPFIKY